MPCAGTSTKYESSVCSTVQIFRSSLHWISVTPLRTESVTGILCIVDE